MSPIAVACRRSLLLLSRLLSAQASLYGGCLLPWKQSRAWSGQAAAWPLSSDRSVRRGSGVKRDFACPFTRHFPPVLVALQAQSCLRLEGRARTLSGPSTDLSPARAFRPPPRQIPPPMQDGATPASWCSSCHGQRYGCLPIHIFSPQDVHFLRFRGVSRKLSMVRGTRS